MLAVCILALATSGCHDVDKPREIKTTENVAGKAVEATLSAEPGPSGPWPEKLGRFSVSVAYPAWYPKSLPDGFKVDSCDVVELDPNTGLVCDTVLISGDADIVLTQGSPKARSYEIVSVGKTPWGDQQADIVYSDPSDTSSPRMIVLTTSDSLAELSGSVGIETLKSVAASMMPVK